jgi:hypothetical protein
VGTAGTAARALQLVGRQAGRQASKNSRPVVGRGPLTLHRGLLDATTLPCAGLPKSSTAPSVPSGSACRPAAFPGGLHLQARRSCSSAGRALALSLCAAAVEWEGVQQPASSTQQGSGCWGAARRVSADLVAPAALLSHAKPLAASFVRTNWSACGWAPSLGKASQTDGQPCSRGSHV